MHFLHGDHLQKENPYREPENPFLQSSDVVSIKPKSLTVPPTSVKNDFWIEQSSVNKTTAEMKSSEAVSK